MLAGPSIPTRGMLISTFFSLNSWTDVNRGIYSYSAWIQPRSGTSSSVFRAFFLTRYPHPSSQCPIHHLYTWRILVYWSTSHQWSWPFYSHTGRAHWWGNDAGQEWWAGFTLLFLFFSLKQCKGLLRTTLWISRLLNNKVVDRNVIEHC